MAKMSGRKFRTIMVPVVSLLLAVPTIATITANRYAASLDFALGKGERHVVSLTDLSKEDVQFYEHKYKTKEESRNDSVKVAKEAEEKGAVLLKNKDNVLPLAKQAKVTPFGYRYADPLFGGTGSANIDTSDTSWFKQPSVAYAEKLTVNTTVSSKLIDSKDQAVTMEGDGSNAPTNLTEYPSSIYTGTESSCTGTTALIHIARPGTEGYDLLSTKAYDDGTPHQLTLTQNEKDMIAFAKANCDKVVVLVITPTQFMINDLVKDEGIDAIIWTGLPGVGGYEAIANILDGTVNPSGKLSDTWYADFEADPTYKNHLAITLTNPIESGSGSVIEYEEGLYMGYRYYETKFAVDNKFEVFGQQNKTYDDAVNYPFGFGLNYEDDKVTQTLSAVEYKDNLVTVKGTITNAGTREVDEVVQIYYGAPYSANGIEKSAKNLVTFDKVTVQAGKSVNFTLSFEDEDMASYDHKKVYTDKGSYVLEKGDYEIYLGKDAHNSWGSKKINVADTRVYSKDAKQGLAVGKRRSDGVEANNLFEELNQYEKTGGMTTMSRSDMNGTKPTLETTKTLAAEFVANQKAIDLATDKKIGNVEGSKVYHAEAPTEKANNGTKLSNLRGLDYNDEMWDVLLDNIDYESDDVDNALTWALYQTAKVEALGKVETCDNDGTAGLTSTWGGDDSLAAMFGMTSVKVTACCYPAAPTIAATWDVDLAAKYGEQVGHESITNGLSGWYAPGLNLHRSPFGGRNFEYYSEDPVLSGVIAASTVGAAFTKGGLYAYIKHFALNELDMNRSSVAVWANEQVFRELYAKGFEICMKRAVGEEKYYDGVQGKVVTKSVKACRGVMTSMNYIGTESPTNSYACLTDLFRGEWNFEGMVITDFTSGTFKNKDVAIRVGNDIWMAMRKFDLNLSTPTAKWAARNSLKNLCYVVVNSNAYDGVAPGGYAYYDMSPWAGALMVADIAMGALALGAIAWTVVVSLKRREEN